MMCRRVRVVYPLKDLDGLGAGGSCGSTWNILCDNSEASIVLTRATVVLIMKSNSNR